MDFRWNIGNKSISWDVDKKPIPHRDDIEMSGLGISYIVKYGVEEDGSLYLDRHCVWPSLRTVPNDTNGSFQATIQNACLPVFLVNGQAAREYPRQFLFDGVLSVASACADGLQIVRTCFPSTEKMFCCELIELTNTSQKELEVIIQGEKIAVNGYGRGCRGVYIVEVLTSKTGRFVLSSGETLSLEVLISARTANEAAPAGDALTELEQRRRRIAQLTAPLQLDTGNAAIDTMFYFAKLRAGESIFQTKGGLLHSPGGYSYYAATWCNDQIEYAGPWFAYTGDPLANEASLNAYRQYIPFMGPLYRHIPSSIIAEGNDFWEGAGDRGDAAMYAYGAGVFALASGKKEVAKELFGAIEWCLEYCRQKTTPDGVIASDSDELEERFPSGDANLSTSCLCYSGLRFAAVLARELGMTEKAVLYTRRADALETAIEAFFGATVSGFDTYRYYKENQVLRSWICLPLCVGIMNRAHSTVRALLSDKLWTKDGLLTCEGDTTVWDRSTLYGFKGAFISGYGDDVIDQLIDYTQTRLTGERVPYAVEAYPEGGKRHLSGESALYGKVILEGMLAVKPAGLNSFTFIPRLPRGLEHLILRNIHAFGACFDIEVLPDGKARVLSGGKIVWEGGHGREVSINLKP